MADVSAMNQIDGFSMHQISGDDISRLWAMTREMRQSKESQYFETQLEQQNAGTRLVFIIRMAAEDAGFVVLNWRPKYGLFQKLNIPEIQDLNVLPRYRCRGIGNAALAYCEGLARDKGFEQMGIGVALHARSGAAQRIYVQRGYVPDGYGVCYDRAAVCEGETCRLDDDLCLMLVKEL